MSPHTQGKVAACTSHPKLYGETYWGNFRANCNLDTITPEIIGNRNAFAKRWRLRRLLGTVGHYPSTAQGEDFDHPETYRDADGWVVLVVSNYGKAKPPAVLGLGRIPPVYSRGVVSYAGRFASQRELRARLESCGRCRQTPPPDGRTESG